MVQPHKTRLGVNSPQLDIDAFGLAGADRLLVDFTMRFGAAARYKWGERASAVASAEAVPQWRCLADTGLA